MANVFNITIAATDKATKTIREVNKSFSQMLRPVSEAQRSMKAFSREAGFDKLGASIVKVGSSAASTAQQLAKFAAPVLALASIGTVAGIAKLATEWGRLGMEISRTAQTLGVSTSDLQSLRGAAQLAGVSAGDLTSGMKSLGDTMQDALFGRNDNAAAVLQRLGIGIHHTATGAIDTTRALTDLSRVISNIKSPQVQGLVARTFGIEQLLPLIRKGPAAIAAYQRKVAELGGVQMPAAIAAAERFGESMLYLQMAVGGLKTTIGDRLIPVLSPLVDRLTAWIVANRDLIATRITEFVQGFAEWLAKVDFNKVLDGLTNFIKEIGTVVDALGGWKNVALGLGLIMAGPLILSIATLGGSIFSLATVALPIGIKAIMLMTSVMAGAEVGATALIAKLGLLAAAGAAGYGLGMLFNKGWEGMTGNTPGSSLYNSTHARGTTGSMQNGSTSQVVDFFKSKGWTEAQAIGLAANFKRESGLTNDAVGDGGNAYGLAQWHDDRQRNFMKWSGKNIRSSTLEEQMGFANYELTQGSERGAGNALRGATTAGQAAGIVSSLYERPANGAAEAAARGNIANEMQHNLSITLSGLPPGVTAQARKPDGTQVPVKVSAGMPSLSTP